jgi:hypothetical protein
MSKLKDASHYKTLAETLLAQRTTLRAALRRNEMRLEDLDTENRHLRLLLNTKTAVSSRLASVPMAARRRGHGRKGDAMNDL